VGDRGTSMETLLKTQQAAGWFCWSCCSGLVAAVAQRGPVLRSCLAPVFLLILTTTGIDLVPRSPGGGRSPMYSAAVRVLQEEGGRLSPMQVLAALPDGMPLSEASGTVVATLMGVMHRRRQAQVRRQRGGSGAVLFYTCSRRCQCRDMVSTAGVERAPASPRAQVVRGLHRSRNLSCRADVAEMSGRRLVVGEESACHGCHRLLMNRVVHG
jgi:hypothetical protein